ncbi:MAG: hypothetical protein Q9220_005192 [cf. Caloplaca sp. 1 TL-2023]
MTSSPPPKFYNYPPPRAAPETTPYTAPTSSNPVVRGLPLSILGTLSTKTNLIANFLWSNTGFGSLRQIPELADYEPRYDPTVIRLPSHTPQPTSTDGDGGRLSTPKEEKEISPSGHYTSHHYTRLYLTRRTTPTDTITSLLSHISSSPQHSAAFLSINREKVLAAAAASTSRYLANKPLGPLDGVPLAVKDEADLDGYPKTLGSGCDFTRKEGGTSWCVRKWEDAGAIVIGKLNMHELGLDTTNNNPHTNTPLNPYNPEYYTGGSSGASAYACAAGLIPIAHGADGGGSIRIPAAYCGLYGLKPSHGRISILPTTSLASSNGVMGPLASSMQDLEVAYRVLAIPDPSNPVSAAFEPPPTTISRSLSPANQKKKRTLGICDPWISTSSPAVLSAFNEAIAHYGKTLGYTTTRIHLPHLHAAQLAHAITILSEITSGVPATAIPNLTPANKILLSVGARTPATDFLLAQKMRQLLMQHLAYLWHQNPGMLIVTPTTPNAGWPIDDPARDLKYGVSDADMSVRSMRFVWLANFTGCPAISIPAGMAPAERGEGRVSVGMMAMGEWGDEESLLEWGREGEEWAWGKSEGGRLSRAKGWEDAMAKEGGWVGA